MTRHFDVTDRLSLQSEQPAESIWAQQASDAWKGKSAAAAPPVKELEKFIDGKINRTTASEDERQPMKAIAHAVVENDLPRLDKLVKDLGKDPAALDKLAEELQEAFRRSGLRFTVNFDTTNNVLELDDQDGLRHLYLFTDADKVPMGTTTSSVDYKTMNESGISDEVARVMKENATLAAEALQKSMLKRFADLSGK